jgi:hypothetical protein
VFIRSRIINSCVNKLLLVSIVLTERSLQLVIAILQKLLAREAADMR